MIEVGTIDKNCCDGKEISPGVWGIGQLSWDDEHQRWQTLANVYGALCLIEVKIKPVPSKD